MKTLQLKVLQLLIKANMWPVRSAIQGWQREGTSIIHTVRIALKKKEKKKLCLEHCCCKAEILQPGNAPVTNAFCTQPTIGRKKGNF